MPYHSPTRTPRITKQELSYLPFSDLGSVANENLEETVKELGLVNYSSWMMPQLLALFGSFKTYKNDDGLYEWTPFLEQNIGRDPHLLGIWKVCARLKRGAIVKGQNTTQGAKYSALVPLILAGVKEAQGINYSEWTEDSIPRLVDKLLAEAMLVPANDIPDLGLDRILEIRRQGLTTMSGASSGQVVKPTSKWSLTGLKDTEVSHLPTHVITMMCQTWVAHPSLRHPLMVLDPNDWDTMPPPLIEAEITAKPSSKMFYTASNKAMSETPWD